MGSVKYSEIEQIADSKHDYETEKIIETEFDKPYESIRIYNTVGDFEVTVNNSKPIVLGTGDDIVLEDFQVNKIKIESLKPNMCNKLNCYVCR